MKHLTFTAYQGALALIMTFTIGNSRKEDTVKSKVCGSICNELFDWVSLQKFVGANGIKLSEPINLKFEVNGIKFDTGTLKKELQARLLLRNNPQGRRNYARRFNAIFNYITRDVKPCTFDELLARITKEEKAILRVAA